MSGAGVLRNQAWNALKHPPLQEKLRESTHAQQTLKLHHEALSARLGFFGTGPGVQQRTPRYKMTWEDSDEYHFPQKEK